MSYLVRMISIPLIAAVLFLSAGCGPATVTVGAGNDGYSNYRYGDRRLPLDYFYYDNYYDGYDLRSFSHRSHDNYDNEDAVGGVYDS